MTSITNCLKISLLMMAATGAIASSEEALNEDLPVMVDENTELQRISLGEHSLTYCFEIKNIDTETACQYKEIEKGNIEETACHDEIVQQLIKNDLDVKFIYNIKKHKILEVTINKQLCSQMKDDLGFEYRNNPIINL
ncbi:hypothetical protein [Legionella jordanis]|uniref:Uncharacterized protein n=1 Tax=Legionella jordanis TaxID=456 RepID=A0A0W0VG34_9GAMM|nr:hypothetical protein [Legionella jordanis]KTD19096.1 hypothetical protein Ljor_0062 [Legionella jordanis]RMW99308.1 hypothetical protein EAW55_13965 [Legionella jordanis]VEH12938.1 Uncharacterised protein [Legionella jordanis]HAT8715286.1 hypothetical protein [Legionella jordanis]